MVVDDRAADAAYLAMAAHFDSCHVCTQVGAELADPTTLCEAGRTALERWLNEEFRGVRTADAAAR